MFHFIRQAFTDADLQRIGLAVIWGASLALMFVIVYVVVMTPVVAYRVWKRRREWISGRKRSGVPPWPIPGVRSCGASPHERILVTHWHYDKWCARHPVTGQISLGENAWQACALWFVQYGDNAQRRAARQAIWESDPDWRIPA